MADPTARTLELLSLLQTHRQWRGGDLADRLGISERTLRRDVDRLRSLGYPVEATTGSAGGYQLTAGTHLPPLLFNDDEAIAMVVGLQAAAGAAIGGMEETTAQVMAKLHQILPDRLRRRTAALHQSMETLQSPAGPTITPETLTVLSQGCRDQEEVRFEYRRRDGDTSHRLVQPHHLVAARRRWYLVAWDVRRDDWRLFRLDRMNGPSLAGARFERRVLPNPDAAAFVAQGLTAWTSDHRAVLKVGRPLAEVAPLAGWLGADTEAAGPDHTLVTCQTERIDWLAAMVTMVAGWAPTTLVSADEALRAQLRIATEQVLAATNSDRSATADL